MKPTLTLLAALLLAPLAVMQAAEPKALTALKEAAPGASEPLPPPAAFSFAPNQLAASPWYRSGNPQRVVNGHLDESFGRKELWPVLMQNLKKNRGSFGITAAEIGHLKDDPRATPNAICENTLVAITEYLRGSGMYDKGMQIRVGSWSHRPSETGAEVHEAAVGSLAHTANQIMNLP